MTPSASAALRAVWAESDLAKILAIVESELRKLRHDPTELVTRAVQPVLWLVIFGQAMGQLRAIPTGDYSYLQFLTPGVLAQSVVFSAIFFGIAVIWERDLGILQKLLVTPTPRYVLVVGKMLAAGLRALTQACVVLALAWLLGVPLRLGPAELAGCLLAILLAAGFFTGFSTAIAALVRTRERFMGIGQLITMPLFFASSALYPLDLLPAWLRVVATVNPLTYLVHALRALLLPGASMAHVRFDLALLAGAAALAAGVSAYLYPRMAT